MTKGQIISYRVTYHVIPDQAREQRGDATCVTVPSDLTGPERYWRRSYRLVRYSVVVCPWYLNGISIPSPGVAGPAFSFSVAFTLFFSLSGPLSPPPLPIAICHSPSVALQRHTHTLDMTRQPLLKTEIISCRIMTTIHCHDYLILTRRLPSLSLSSLFLFLFLLSLLLS